MRNAILVTVLILLTAYPVQSRNQIGAAQFPPLEKKIVITDWWVIGPMQSGSREPLANPMGTAFDPDTGEVDLSKKYMSLQEYGGRVGWTKTTADEEGVINFKFDNPDWDKIVDEWGGAGAYFTCAAYAVFDVPTTCRALADAQGIGSFSINGRLYSGDPYGHGILKTPVLLDEGENRIFFFSGGYGGEDSVSFKLEPPPAESLMFLKSDCMLPDIVRGESLKSPSGLTILNTTNEWIREIVVETGGDDNFTLCSNKIDILAPLSLIKIPVDVELKNPIGESWADATINIPVSVERSDIDEKVTDELSARIRNPGDSILRTFISRNDNSCQKYAVRYPVNYDPSKRYGLVLALHGAGVECEGMADAFESEDWAFIVNPTNRRRFGFDWQDWGRLDAIEILDLCTEIYPIDPDRVCLIGHSMGGHGTWHVGCTHAERFACIVPSAGWASFQLYTPFFLRSDDIFFDSECRRIFEACMSPDRTERILGNLRNTPVLAVQGGNDDDVPPTHARLLTGILDRMGYDVEYWEEPGQGHWWDTNPDLPGAHCVDAPRIRSFMREHKRNPRPRHVTLITYDLGNTNSKYWVSVNEEIGPLGGVYVDAEATEYGFISCKTLNVKELEFNLSTDAFPQNVSEIKVEIDNQKLTCSPDENGRAIFTNYDGTWQVGKIGSSGMHKTPEFRGPIKRAYFKPFVIVAGTSGTEEENAFNLESAMNLQTRWWYRANGYSTIISDKYFEEKSGVTGYNLILIGGPSSNSVSAKMADSFPIKIESGGVALGDKFIPGTDLAVKFVYPNPFSEGTLICADWGTSMKGMRLAMGLTCLYSGSGLPDFLVYDDDVKLGGYASVRAAGFFNNDWQVDSEYYFINHMR